MEARRQQLVREKQSSAQGPKSSQANEASLLNEEQMKSEIQKQLSQNQNTQIKKHVFILNERESYPSTEADMLNGQDTVAKPLRKVNRHVVSPEAFSFTQQIMNLVMEIEKARKSYSEQEQAETDRLYQIFCQKLQSTQNRAAFLERFTLILGMLFGTDKSKQIMQKFEVQSTIFFIQSKKIKAITQQSQKACGTSLLEQSAHKHTNSFTSAFPAAGMPSPKYNNSSYMSSSSGGNNPLRSTTLISSLKAQQLQEQIDSYYKKSQQTLKPYLQSPRDGFQDLFFQSCKKIQPPELDISKNSWSVQALKELPPLFSPKSAASKSETFRLAGSQPNQPAKNLSFFTTYSGVPSKKSQFTARKNLNTSHTNSQCVTTSQQQPPSPSSHGSKKVNFKLDSEA